MLVTDYVRVRCDLHAVLEHECWHKKQRKSLQDHSEGEGEGEVVRG